MDLDWSVFSPTWIHAFELLQSHGIYIEERQVGLGQTRGQVRVIDRLGECICLVKFEELVDDMQRRKVGAMGIGIGTWLPVVKVGV